MNEDKQLEAIMEAIHHEVVYGNPSFVPEPLEEKIRIILQSQRQRDYEEIEKIFDKYPYYVKDLFNEIKSKLSEWRKE